MQFKVNYQKLNSKKRTKDTYMQFNVNYQKLNS